MQDFQRVNRRGHDDDHWNEVHEQLLAIQKKSIEVSDPNDADEKEADEVARKVSDGESAEIHGTGGTINRKGEGITETTAEFNSKLNNSKGGGKSLDGATKSEMESKMGADFSEVKIHTGSEANEMNESVNAKAFTHGQDIYFGDGNFNAGTGSGKELLAHELTHTVQQGKGTQTGIQRAIDLPGSVRILQKYMNVPVTGNKADTQKSNPDVISTQWPSDEVIVKNFFDKTAEGNFVETKQAFKTLPADTETNINNALDDTTKLETSITGTKTQLTAADATKKRADLIAIKKLIFGETDTVEQQAEKVAADEANLKILLPARFNDDESVKSLRTNLLTHQNATYTNSEGTFYINQSTFPDNEKRIKTEVDRTLKGLKTATSKYFDSWFNAASSYLDIALTMYEEFDHYEPLFTRYKEIFDELKEISSDEGKYKEKRKAKIGLSAADKTGERRDFMQLLQVVVDMEDISYDNEGILTIHYDTRVNDIPVVTDSTKPSTMVVDSIDEAKDALSTEKIIIDNRLMGVVITEKTGLKEVKLGVWPFDSLSYMRKTLKAALAVAPPADPNAGVVAQGRFLRKVKDGTAVAYNNGKLHSKSSIKIIQNLIGAPSTGVFDQNTVALLFRWQKANGIKPPKADRGKLRDIDIEKFFSMLIVNDTNLPDLYQASGQFNSALHLVMDYYDLIKGAMSMKESQFEMAGTAQATVSVQTQDEMFNEMYYERDSDTEIN